MADISVMNVGGTDYNIKDSTSRTNSTKAMSLPAYYETGTTASQAYSIVGTPINWKGTLYYTKTTVAEGATWTVGTNLTAATNLGKLVRNIKTYVGSDSKLHFVDLTGADTALNFSSGVDLASLYAGHTIFSSSGVSGSPQSMATIITWLPFTSNNTKKLVIRPTQFGDYVIIYINDVQVYFGRRETVTVDVTDKLSTSLCKLTVTKTGNYGVPAGYIDISEIS